MNRIFEGSSEIMHLMIAREAVDQHLKAARDLLTPGGDFKAKAEAALHAGVFYSKWLPQLAVGKGQNPRFYDEFGELAELFCEQAKERAETLFNELWSNRDDANCAAAQRVLDGRYTWLEEGIVDPSGDGPMMPPLVEPAAAGDRVTVSRDASAAVVTRSRS